MTAPDWDDLARALLSRVPTDLPEPVAARAAVALVFRDGSSGIELLFIRRAEDERDPWSGHVGFPGGRAEPGDADRRGTAVRETLEETGLDLARDGEALGRLDEVRALARGRPVDLAITPFVFRLRRRLEGRTNPEVVSLHWLSLGRLLDPTHQSTMDYRHEGAFLRLPCLRLEDLVIWGLTYRMFESLRALLAASG